MSACHRVGGRGGDTGPDLSKVGAQRNREYLLESIVVPNRQITPGYQTATLALADHFYTGRLLSEDAESVKLETTDDAGERKQDDGAEKSNPVARRSDVSHA